MDRVAIEPLMRGTSAYTQVVLHAASRRHVFGISLGPAEREWVATEIRNHLDYAGMRAAAAKSFRSACDRPELP